jgi:hypothetical protein
MRFTREEEPLLPFRAVCCPVCAVWQPVEDGMTALETLWMHEYECSAICTVNELVPDRGLIEFEVEETDIVAEMPVAAAAA